ncbi:Uncharacterised protein [Dorea longicatena]|nr:Uncharacterised protein [Dorea longicatena]
MFERVTLSLSEIALSLALYTQNQFRRLVCRTPSIKTSIKKQLLGGFYNGRKITGIY